MRRPGKTPRISLLPESVGDTESHLEKLRRVKPRHTRSPGDATGGPPSHLLTYQLAVAVGVGQHVDCPPHALMEHQSWRERSTESSHGENVRF